MTSVDPAREAWTHFCTDWSSLALLALLKLCCFQPCPCPMDLSCCPWCCLFTLHHASDCPLACWAGELLPLLFLLWALEQASDFLLLLIKSPDMAPGFRAMLTFRPRLSYRHASAPGLRPHPGLCLLSRPC